MKTIRVHFADKDDVVAIDNVPENITAGRLMPMLFKIINETDYRTQIKIMCAEKLLEDDDEVFGTDIVLHISEKYIPWFSVALNLFIFACAHFLPLHVFILTRNILYLIMTYLAGVLCIGLVASVTRPPGLSIFKCWKSYRHRETNVLEIIYLFFWAMLPNFKQEYVAMW